MKTHHLKQLTLSFLLTCISSAILFGQVESWSGTMQVADISPYVGKKIKLEASVKVASDHPDAKAQLWVRIDKADNTMGFFDNMDDRPVRSGEWKVCSIEGTVDEHAKIMNFGSLVFSEGKFYFDGFKLSVWQENEWKMIPIENPGFEVTGAKLKMFPGWGKIANDFDSFYELSAYQTDVVEGENALLIEGKEYFPAADLLRKYIGEWSYVFVDSLSTGQPQNFGEGQWVFEPIVGNYGIEGTFSLVHTNLPIGDSIPLMKMVISYYPDMQKIYMTFHVLEYLPSIFQGSLDKKGNIITKQIQAEDHNAPFTANWSFNWVNDHELGAINKVAVNDGEGKVITYYFRMSRKESVE